jgi:hypothetical protein
MGVDEEKGGWTNRDNETILTGWCDRDRTKTKKMHTRIVQESKNDNKEQDYWWRIDTEVIQTKVRKQVEEKREWREHDMKVQYTKTEEED